MKLRIGVRSPLRWCAGVVFLVAFGTFCLAQGADARGLDAVQPTAAVRVEFQRAEWNAAHEARPSSVEADPIRRWTGAVRFGTAPETLVHPVGQSAPADSRAEAQRGYRGRRGRGDRGVGGLVLGALGGFAAGGAIGVAVGERYCHCDNPGLHGFVIGAPIGAVIGGFIGYALAR